MRTFLSQTAKLKLRYRSANCSLRIDLSKHACCLLSSLLGCALPVTNIQAQPVQKIYINPKSPAVQKQSAIVDSIRFTPFESAAGVSVNENSPFRVTDKYFLVTDFGTGCLYIYSKTGAFVKRVEFKSTTNDIYPAYNAQTNELVFFGNNSNYTLTSKDRVKIQTEWDKERNLKYFRKYLIDLDDTAFALKKVKPDKYDLIGASALFAGRYIQTGITTSPLYKDSAGYEVNIYENGKLVNSYFPYNHVNEPKFLYTDETVSVSSADSPFIAYLSRPFCDTIYKLTKDRISPLYQLVVPVENAIPAAFFTDGSLTKTDRQNLRRNNGWAFQQVRDFYETPRFIYLAMRFFTHFERYVYDKQIRTTYNTAKIKGDAQQYNLSLFAWANVVRSGRTFYKLVKADVLNSFFNQNLGAVVPRELAPVLQAGADKDRLVLVAFTIKD